MDWDTVDLVVFDVDGTLYDQRRLRIRMARELVTHTLLRCDLTAMRVLRTFRNRREALAEAGAEDFEARLLRETATATGVTPAAVEAIVAEWILRRPLRHLRACRYPAVDDLFAGLVRAGKTVGILSDYPARDKLLALGLEATFVVTAGDAGRLKPHPQGLLTVMAQAGASPARTLLIGDRPERDGIAAQRAGTRFLIRTAQTAGDTTFARFDAPVFAPVLAV
ncbi:HAD family hydrolase [Acetobacter oeni]|uniref:phosphoglycolate phosphatase n=1 Tax=Acetobacter oeni TaxID=304077 RepID=A0A511XJ72_9PROT|nr:HAD family hydrolase [Acetobacter oeni]MBB3882817.1 putative hydrolase of the HAD superfamily [Acetobacter oeni]NHO18906.1 HAD-IA family hydrolase [Acetobacter oeni]GBR09628.1 putative hydrolase [Acetobacter oeni LMG 21952]GEN62996.1 phosphoglycolate phosphatase [Acetobacter oeni]